MKIRADTMTNEDTNTWRFLPATISDGCTNMAIDEAILVTRIKGLVPNTVRVYQWSPSTVTIGRHQSVALEVDTAEINRRKFQLVRRISGGGAVLHAESKEITYSVVAKIPDLTGSFRGTKNGVEAIYQVILDAIQKTLSKISLSPVAGVIHCPALLLDGKKFSGNAQCIKNGYVLQHGTILLSVDPDEMYSVLKPPQGVTKGRMVRSVMAKVVGLEECIGHKIDPHDFGTAFKETFSTLLGITFRDGKLVPAEASLLDGLKAKYVSEEWRLKYP
nr:biotin/lipoate A/B protein ligase family protein [Candidatus Sigynarchaeota archaeon]